MMKTDDMKPQFRDLSLPQTPMVTNEATDFIRIKYGTDLNAFLRDAMREFEAKGREIHPRSSKG